MEYPNERQGLPASELPASWHGFKVLHGAVKDWAHFAGCVPCGLCVTHICSEISESLGAGVGLEGVDGGEGAAATTTISDATALRNTAKLYDSLWADVGLEGVDGGGGAAAITLKSLRNTAKRHDSLWADVGLEGVDGGKGGGPARLCRHRQHAAQ